MRVPSYSHSLTVNNGRIAIACITRSGHLDVVRRGAGGHWFAPTRLPHSHSAVFDALVAYNPSSGHLHVTWDEHNRRPGVLTERFIRGHWVGARRIGKGPLDSVTSLTFTPRGRAVVGYVYES